MASCFYKKIAIVLAITLLILPSSSFGASSVMWPSEMNLFNDTINLDDYVPEDATSSNSKKGLLFTGDPKDIFELGCGHVAINVCISGKGHVYLQLLEGLKKRGIKITLILINDRVALDHAPGRDTPEEYRNPYLYMIDFNSSNGEWLKFNFDRIVNDYAKYADNWIIGNEINCQQYNFYGPANISEYTKVYCDSFKIMYEKIKKANKDANLYISFDQGWDLPQYREKSGEFDKINGLYRYNTKQQLELINKYLDKDIDWGVALHPYPTPVDDAKFWDDQFAGLDAKSEDEKERPYLLTAKNFEVALKLLKESRFLTKDKKQRKVIISEMAFTSHNGEEIQAAGLYYTWEKIMKYNENIEALLYNAQTDITDGYDFGLTSTRGRKRLAWVVYRDMDDEKRNSWCKDLLDRILEEYGYYDNDTIITKIPKETKLEVKNDN